MMPIDYKAYPENRKEIRARILKRAGNCCEFCGVENHTTVQRDTGAPCLIDEDGAIFVVLTIAHLDHDAENKNVRDERLAALCQRCHISYDAPRKAAERRCGDLFKS